MRVFVLKVRWWYVVLGLVVALAGLVPQFREPLFLAVTSQKRLVPIYAVQTEGKQVAISFDATWGTELTDEILDILAEHDLQTTFFLAGPWIDKHPDYVVKIREAGHEIGNHSFSHPHMNNLNEQGIAFELKQNEKLITDLTGQKPNLFRPPFGEYNNLVLQTASSLGYYTIQWSVDSLDWKDLSSNQIYDRVMGQIKPGSIVLFHNAAPGTPGAIRRIIPELKNDGYEILAISELIYPDNYYIDHAGTQIPAEGGSSS